MSAYRESAQELGSVLTEHHWTQSRGMVLFGMAMMVAPFFILLLPSGEDWTLMSYLGLIAMFTILPLAGLSLLVDAYRLRSNLVRLHTSALLHRWKGVETVVRFDDIQSIGSKVESTHNGVARHVHHVLLANGTSLVVTHGLEDADVLIEALRARTAPFIKERVRGALERGESVSFGPFELKGDVLSCASNGYADSEVKLGMLSRVEITQGDVVALRVGAQIWARVSVHDVPNAHVFVALLNELTGR